jgi:hypothetical protein
MVKKESDVVKNPQEQNMGLEMRLDEESSRLTGTTPAAAGAKDWRSLREQLRLNVLYQGEYVIHRDHTTGRGRNTRMVRREVAFHSPDLEKAQDFLLGLPEEERPHYHLCYVDMIEANPSRSL